MDRLFIYKERRVVGKSVNNTSPKVDTTRPKTNTLELVDSIIDIEINLTINVI